MKAFFKGAAIPDAALYGLLLLAAALAYANIYGNGFLFDDHQLILDNVFLRAWSNAPRIFLTSVAGGSGGLGGYYRPLAILLYLVIYQLAGFSLFAFHLLNASLHGGNACLLAALLRRLGARRESAFIAALLWALHPIQTEAVAYISGTPDLLYSFFCLLGLRLLAPDFGKKQIWLACAAFLLALLSKESAAVFPPLACLCIMRVTPMRNWRRACLRTWPFWLMLAVFIPLRLANEQAPLAFASPDAQLYAQSLWVRLCSALAMLPDYARLLLWPAGLHMERLPPVHIGLQDGDALAGVMLVLLALAVIILDLRRSKGESGWENSRLSPLSFGLLWFAIAHAPQSGVLVPLRALIFEHWMYLPSAGLIAGLVESVAAAAAAKTPRYRQALLAAMLLLACAAAVATFRQNEIWHDDFSFFENIVDTNHEPSPRARNELGLAYFRKGDDAHALEQFRLSLQMTDGLPEVHENIAALLMHHPDNPDNVRQAIAQLKQAIAIDPDYFPAYSSLVYIYGKILGDRAQADYYRARAQDIIARAMH